MLSCFLCSTSHSGTSLPLQKVLLDYASMMLGGDSAVMLVISIHHCRMFYHLNNHLHLFILQLLGIWCIPSSLLLQNASMNIVPPSCVRVALGYSRRSRHAGKRWGHGQISPGKTSNSLPLLSPSVFLFFLSFLPSILPPSIPTSICLSPFSSFLIIYLNDLRPLKLD